MLFLWFGRFRTFHQTFERTICHFDATLRNKFELKLRTSLRSDHRSVVSSLHLQECKGTRRQNDDVSF